MKKYDMELCTEAGSISNKIFSRIQKGSSVLEMGCSYGRMTKYLKEELLCDVSIVEMDEEAFASAKPYAKNGYCASLEQLNLEEAFADQRFDYILFADVLEHLPDPCKILTQAKALLKEDGEILISIPNICHNDILAELYQNRFSYTSLGLLDNTHVHFWGREDFARFAKDCGYDILLTDACYVNPFCTEQHPKESALPASLRKALKLRDYGDVYQYFFVLKKEGWLKANGVTCAKAEENHTVLQAVLRQSQGNTEFSLVEKRLSYASFSLRCDSLLPSNQPLVLELTLPLPCVICDLRTSAEQTARILPTNGTVIEGFGTVFTAAPQYKVTQLSDGVPFSVTVDLQLLDEAEANALLSLHADLQKQCAQAQAEAKQQQQKLQQAQVRERALQLQLQHAQADLQSVLNSDWWKITKPFRALFDFIKRTRLGSAIYRTLRYLRRYGFRETCKRVMNKLSKKELYDSPETRKPTDLRAMVKYAKKKHDRIYLPKRLRFRKRKGGRTVLLVTHELNLTGAPIALQYLANALVRQGDFPVVISPNDGALGAILRKNGILCMVYPDVYNDTFVPRSADLFDLIVVNTTVGAPLIERLGGTEVPVLWWIHEAKPSYNAQVLSTMPRVLPNNIHVRCVGAYAQKLLAEFRPYYPVDQLLYCVPDYVPTLEKSLRHLREQTTFAIVGMQEYRKGHDILIRAIRMLDAETLDHCKFIFVGKKVYQPIWDELSRLLKEYPDHVTYLEEVDREGMFSLYEQIDCLVCPSRDDPMPIVVTEAMLMEKAIICSENTGSASILRAENAGFVYENNDPAKLAECLAMVSKQTDEALSQLCKNARKAYEDYFSQDVFAKNVQSLMDDLTKPQEKHKPSGISVSVVIPTYNAGAYAFRQLQQLRSQVGIDDLEIIAVDSGSSDQTPQVFRDHGAKVIEIPQSEFSHSYARNLGALHAKGNNLIFMTQDAIPEDAHWARSLLTPILSGEAVATSCAEKCPDDTDLYYKMASWLHVGFLGVLEGDRLNRLEETDSPIDQRSKASLNDVTVAIDKEIFLKFLYRFDFAEDLDLGLRLLKAGHSIKILQSTHTVHGHNRPFGYYTKRAYVEIRTMGKIHPDWAEAPRAQEKVARMVVHSAGLISHAIELFSAKDRSQYDAKEFCDQLSLSLKQAFETQTCSDRPLCDDPIYQWCIETLAPYSDTPCAEESDLLHATLHYVDVVAIRPYAMMHTTGVLSQDLQQTLLDCAIKQFCLRAGHEIAKITPDMPLYVSTQNLAKGV